MDIKITSYNYSVAKVVAIIIVMAGHYFGEMYSSLWTLATVALFVFAFSSGLFTGLKYKKDYSIGSFWNKKITRLLPSLFIINLFLFIIFMYQHKEGIFTWSTIPALFGMNGFLTWFQVPKASPYGHGLWFFTLLIIFYVVYPVLEKINRKSLYAHSFIAFSFLMLGYMSLTVNMGHALWSTGFAFLFGVYSSQYRINYTGKLNTAIFFILGLLILILNFKLNIKQYNTLLIFCFSINTVYFLMYQKLPAAFFNVFILFSGCVLEIYFIHTYLFIDISNKMLGFVFSTATILLTALVLQQTRTQLINIGLTTKQEKKRWPFVKKT